MSNIDANQLKIDPELRLLVCPLSEREYSALEQRIRLEGCPEPVLCWYSYIISGYEQVEICQRLNIPFEIRKVSFRTRVEIVALICKKELERRFLPSAQHRYLIGRLYEAEQIIRAHRVAGTDQRKEKARKEYPAAHAQNLYSGKQIRVQMGSQYHLNPATVTRHATYARGIDRIYQADPEKACAILVDKLKVPVKEIMEYGSNPEEARLPETSEKPVSPATVPELLETGPNIKDMPAFDPDAEINSLSLTIPSWVQSLARTRNTAKFQLITQDGRERLTQELRRLISAADKMLSALEVR